ncbi:ATP-binding protein [Picrophilus oshimae]|uniref:ATP-dependent Lon protease n=1 Tax=Picrophilus torridus (strain ATCC 700027 / DSM 9790 / JCM 10055 / NBRC 100828 / KAW 2/3) TaxID=1122961 RepID=A0A8G2FW07_PICTO|nr:ATP-binding protein [Picrophilus oshimae]SMD30491.1 ATP-dependent Lon protease [Picrophilus oshimae DSM 9789]
MGSYINFDEYTDTSMIKIPANPLDRVIGQDEAVKLALMAARQRRNLLLVGPPGVGKSMIAQAMSFYLPRPQEEIRVVHNPVYPERPFVEVKTRDEIEREKIEMNSIEGQLIDPKDAPQNVAERLGYRCPHCGFYSSPSENVCPQCGNTKMVNTAQSPFSDVFNVIGAAFGVGSNERVTQTRRIGEHEEVIVYERQGDKIRVMDEKTMERRRKIEKKSPSKVIVPIDRNPFVLATGASETELLGDVRHDPYGGHPQLGTLPYERVVAGAVHMAHEGVLFIDEITHLGNLQRFILTAMQEKSFPIIGRNPQSAGASVRVDDVPSDFILVAACNIADLQYILSPLRSRIIGNGYEILMETVMEDNEKNRLKYLQFIAQEINMDGRIPHMTIDGAYVIIQEGRRKAKEIDGKDNALSLRLRELGGLVRAAGDIAVENNHKLIEKGDVIEALKLYIPVEEKIKKYYGSMENALRTEATGSQKGVYNYSNGVDDGIYN